MTRGGKGGRHWCGGQVGFIQALVHRVGAGHPEVWGSLGGAGVRSAEGGGVYGTSGAPAWHRWSGILSEASPRPGCRLLGF